MFRLPLYETASDFDYLLLIALKLLPPRSHTHAELCAALMWIPTVVWVIILSSPRAEQEIFTMRIFMMLFCNIILIFLQRQAAAAAESAVHLTV